MADMAVKSHSVQIRRQKLTVLRFELGNGKTWVQIAAQLPLMKLVLVHQAAKKPTDK